MLIQSRPITISVVVGNMTINKLTFFSTQTLLWFAQCIYFLATALHYTEKMFNICVSK